jgi:hypothetical protein
MNSVALWWIGTTVAVIFAGCINYEALSMAKEPQSAPRRLGVFCGACGITCMVLLPFMLFITLLQFFAGNPWIGAHLTRGIFFVAVASTFGSLSAVSWTSWRDRRGA